VRDFDLLRYFELLLVCESNSVTVCDTDNDRITLEVLDAVKTPVSEGDGDSDVDVLTDSVVENETDRLELSLACFDSVVDTVRRCETVREVDLDALNV